MAGYLYTRDQTLLSRAVHSAAVAPAAYHALWVEQTTNGGISTAHALTIDEFHEAAESSVEFPAASPLGQLGVLAPLRPLGLGSPWYFRTPVLPQGISTGG